MNHPTTYTIAQIEQAINVWRARRPAGENCDLCREARKLAEPYTLMFLDGRDTITADHLSDEQNEFMRSALGLAA